MLDQEIIRELNVKLVVISMSNECFFNKAIFILDGYRVSVNLSKTVNVSVVDVRRRNNSLAVFIGQVGFTLVFHVSESYTHILDRLVFTVSNNSCNSVVVVKCNSFRKLHTDFTVNHFNKRISNWLGFISNNYVITINLCFTFDIGHVLMNRRYNRFAVFIRNNRFVVFVTVGKVYGNTHSRITLGILNFCSDSVVIVKYYTVRKNYTDNSINHFNKSIFDRLCFICDKYSVTVYYCHTGFI